MRDGRLPPEWVQIYIQSWFACFVRPMSHRSTSQRVTRDLVQPDYEPPFQRAAQYDESAYGQRHPEGRRLTEVILNR
jgi:hypothetical protein